MDLGEASPEDRLPSTDLFEIASLVYPHQQCFHNMSVPDIYSPEK